ncbi:MGAT4A_B [Acanthosepion pharaonis]|uniref:MGAT4A_B n=1 Tax=Acanthosepion pharaonis TaxID=158019 RepID=A0A812D6A8_ACAPH|nr:MGAT4A_B [Sepia pharaonis]
MVSLQFIYQACSPTCHTCHEIQMISCFNLFFFRTSLFAPSFSWTSLFLPLFPSDISFRPPFLSGFSFRPPFLSGFFFRTPFLSGFSFLPTLPLRLLFPDHPSSQASLFAQPFLSGFSFQNKDLPLRLLRKPNVPLRLLFPPTLPLRLLFPPTLPLRLLFPPTLPLRLLFPPTLPLRLLSNPSSQASLSAHPSSQAFSMVFGIPTIKREKVSYLLRTLHSLIDGLNEEEREDCLLIVFVAEVIVGEQIYKEFKSSVDSGLVEVISAPAEFYPNLNHLKETLGDSQQRVRWRTKQNLDFSFLMLYAKSKGVYYVQLEDDVISKPGYLSIMKTFTQQQKYTEWLVLEFSTLVLLVSTLIHLNKLTSLSSSILFCHFFLSLSLSLSVSCSPYIAMFSPSINYLLCLLPLVTSSCLTTPELPFFLSFFLSHIPSCLTMPFLSFLAMPSSSSNPLVSYLTLSLSLSQTPPLGLLLSLSLSLSLSHLILPYYLSFSHLAMPSLFSKPHLMFCLFHPPFCLTLPSLSCHGMSSSFDNPLFSYHDLSLSLTLCLFLTSTVFSHILFLSLTHHILSCHIIFLSHAMPSPFGNHLLSYFAIPSLSLMSTLVFPQPLSLSLSFPHHILSCHIIFLLHAMTSPFGNHLLSYFGIPSLSLSLSLIPARACHSIFLYSSCLSSLWLNVVPSLFNFIHIFLIFTFSFLRKLFKSNELPILVEFFLMFHTDKPIDWLLDHYLSVKVCNPEKDNKHCFRMKDEVRRRYKPSLFQHIGMQSSLKGKVQKLKDKYFGKQGLYRAHVNPKAHVSTTLKTYQQYTLLKAYLGETFFWGISPRPNDIIKFEFTPPVVLEKFLFRSGNLEHPGDKLTDTTVEIFPSSHKHLVNLKNNEPYQTVGLGYYVVSRFNSEGVAEGQIKEVMGPIKVLRLHCQAKSDSWAILSEIYIKAKTEYFFFSFFPLFFFFLFFSLFLFSFFSFFSLLFFSLSFFSLSLFSLSLFFSLSFFSFSFFSLSFFSLFSLSLFFSLSFFSLFSLSLFSLSLFFLSLFFLSLSFFSLSFFSI